MKEEKITFLELAKEIVKDYSLKEKGFVLSMIDSKNGISIALEVPAKEKAFNEKPEKEKKTQQNKKVQDYSAVDAFFNTPKTEDEIAKETEERNRKLKERFNNTGNVEPAVFNGD